MSVLRLAVLEELYLRVFVEMLIWVVIWKEVINWRIFRGNYIRDFGELFSKCVSYCFMMCVDFVIDNDTL